MAPNVKKKMSTNSSQQQSDSAAGYIHAALTFVSLIHELDENVLGLAVTNSFHASDKLCRVMCVMEQAFKNVYRCM